MAESKLAKFVEDIIVPPRMIDIIVDGEVLMPFVFLSIKSGMFVYFLVYLQGEKWTTLELRGTSPPYVNFLCC